MLWCCCGTEPGTVVVSLNKASWRVNIVDSPGGVLSFASIGRMILSSTLQEHRSMWVRTKFGVNIPQSATIVSARLITATGNEIDAYLNPFDTIASRRDSPTADVVKAIVYAHDVDDSPLITTYAGYTAATRTTASISWNPVNDPVGPTGFIANTMPDLAAVIQEVIDRPGWARFNHLQVFFDENASAIVEHPSFPFPSGEAFVNFGEFGEDWALVIDWTP